MMPSETMRDVTFRSIQERNSNTMFLGIRQSTLANLVAPSIVLECIRRSDSSQYSRFPFEGTRMTINGLDTYSVFVRLPFQFVVPSSDFTSIVQSKVRLSTRGDLTSRLEMDRRDN